MPSDAAIEVIGVVVKVLPAPWYKVKLDNAPKCWLIFGKCEIILHQDRGG
jgi:translation initiation factor IF-1